jgi:hypothetical protein
MMEFELKFVAKLKAPRVFTTSALRASVALTLKEMFPSNPNSLSVRQNFQNKNPE